MPSNPPLTDEEISRKFGIPADHPQFAAARGLARGRHDVVICKVPEMQCQHCGHEFTATYYDLGSNDPANGNEISCVRCERTIYVEQMTEPDEEGYDGVIYVTLNTDPYPGKD